LARRFPEPQSTNFYAAANKSGNAAIFAPDHFLCPEAAMLIAFSRAAPVP
jgi:hypothetical protein